MQRQCSSLANGEQASVSIFHPEKDMFIGAIQVTLSGNFPVKQTINAQTLREMIQKNFLKQIFTINQIFAISYSNLILRFTVKHINLASLEQLMEESVQLDTSKKTAHRGIFVTNSHIVFNVESKSITLEGDTDKSGSLTFKRPNLNPEDMGIGGLDAQFADIFRRAFISRIYPPELIRELGQTHVKGILLYGPPGTGKTLMAREISKMFNGKEPKIVAGPEILNKYVGQSEENIRNLFADAEAEYKEKGDNSDLHVIVLDELDAICKQRGSNRDGTGTGDSIVNQLLAKMDGVESLNNILVIGMTNRRDMIDKALLRPGRFEVQLEVSLPDEKGRLSIFRIHTRDMKRANHLDQSVNLDELAERTKNFSGSEIAGLVRSATSFALSSPIINETDMNKVMAKLKKNQEHIVVKQEHFLQALEEVKPAFGADELNLSMLMPNGIISFGKTEEIISRGITYAKQVKESSLTPLVSILLQGDSGVGKTALAAQIAKQSGFYFIKAITPESLVDADIIGLFRDAYKSQYSIIILDEIEKLIEYIAIGPRFNNNTLQKLQTYLKVLPPPGHKLLIIGTTSHPDVLREFELNFDQSIDVDSINGKEELKFVLENLNELKGKIEPLSVVCEAFGDKRIPIKELIFNVAFTLAQEGTPEAKAAILGQALASAGRV